MTGTDLLVAIAIAVGLAGVLIPALPGSALVGAAILAWALAVGTTGGWLVFAVAAAFLLVGTVVKYAVPGRRLKRAGTPASTLLLGGLLGVVGFFVIPVVGLPIGFMLGVYLAELRRLGNHGQAWPATLAALRAVGVSILIEFAAALAAAVTWAVGLLLV